MILVCWPILVARTAKGVSNAELMGGTLFVGGWRGRILLDARCGACW